MKKLTKELHTKTEKDLDKEVMSLREEIAKLMIERSVKPEKDSNTINKKKKRLAVVLTLINQKKIAITK
jgi:ribosomal protein L29